MTKKKKVWIAICLILICGMVYYKMNYVYFYDQELESIVRIQLFGDDSDPYHKKQPLKGFLRKKDIERIDSIYINLRYHPVKDVRDLKKMKNLESIRLSHSLAYRYQKDIEYGEMPKNMDVIHSLKKLKRLDLFAIKIDGSFQKGHPTVKTLIIQKCIIGDESFPSRFPQVNHLSIDECEVLSLDFVRDMGRLAYLRLSENRYQCTMEALESAQMLIELWISSNNREIFEQLPEVRTVTKLLLKGEAAPDRTQMDKYLEWESLKRLRIKGEWYDVETGAWDNEGSD